jgi:lipid-binding SYLF domain-containing protein
MKLMLNFLRKTAVIACFAMAAAATSPLHAQAREEAKLLVATEVLDQLRNSRDQQIPERLLQRAYAIVVVPDVTKVAFVLGGRRGTGAMTVRDSRGRFSNPVFVNLTGGSVGWQIGAQETDIVLVFTTKRGVEGIVDGELTLGAGASVAAGPVGRQGEVAASVNAEVFAYSRARGLFAGVALDGTALTIDKRGNRAFYGRRDLPTADILDGKVTKDSENVRRFLAAIASSTGESAATQTNAPAAPAGNVGAPAAAPMEAAPVRTFPMEDQAPGQEPPR